VFNYSRQLKYSYIIMKKFDELYKILITEFNVQDRNDPSFYDYVVILLQQIKQRNLLPPEKLVDIRRTATQVVKDGYYNFIDEQGGVSLKISFIFDTNVKDVNNLKVNITNLLDPKDETKTIDNAHEESSIDDIGNYIQSKKAELDQAKGAGTEVPAAVGETPSQMPDATAPVSTSQYLKGL